MTDIKSTGESKLPNLPMDPIRSSSSGGPALQRTASTTGQPLRRNTRWLLGLDMSSGLAALEQCRSSQYAHPILKRTIEGVYCAVNTHMVVDAPPGPNESEDCLFLDVFVSNTTFNTGAAPVVVWIHGGGYIRRDKTEGGSPIGLLERSAEQGEEAVFVRIGYRVRSLPSMFAIRAIQQHSH